MVLLPEEQKMGPVLRLGRSRDTTVSLKQAAAGLVFAALVWSAVFHIAYFNVVGVEFLSLTSTYDLLFSAGVMLVPLIFYSAFAYYIYAVVATAKLQSTWLNAYFALSAVIFALGVILTSALHIFVGEKAEVATLTHGFSLFTTGMVAATGFLLARQGYVPVIFLSTLAVMVTLTAWLVGGASARHGGIPCTLKTTDGSYGDVRYLRGLGDGHLFASDTGNKRIRFVPSRRVSELYCERPDDMWIDFWRFKVMKGETCLFPLCSVS